MNPDNYGLVEMGFSFGVILAIAFWQLYSVRKAMRIAREKEEAEKMQRDSGDVGTGGDKSAGP